MHDNFSFNLQKNGENKKHHAPLNFEKAFERNYYPWIDFTNECHFSKKYN